MLQWLIDPEHAPSGAQLIAGIEAALPAAFAKETV
jgi:hypothetical protein